MNIHQKDIIGNLTMFDRIIFKGHLTSLFPKRAFEVFLNRQNILLKDFNKYVQKATNLLKERAEQIASQNKKEIINIRSRKAIKSKEKKAREIAEKENIKEGLICILSAMEVCNSFKVCGNRKKKKLEIVRGKRQCLHYYYYFMDSEFGFMHVKIQSWFPFEIQIYVNGREWLKQQIDRKGIKYIKYDNSFLRMSDIKKVEKICKRFAHKKWPRVLNRFAKLVNPMLQVIKKVGFGSYYWVINQSEIATDIMFKDRQSLKKLMPDLFEYSMTVFSANDVMKFLGRKLYGQFRGEVITDFKKRPEGYRVKHRMKNNYIKMYDKYSVLRIETTINNSREFKILITDETIRGEKKRRWKYMNKGVANMWRYYQVATSANNRYLEALSHVKCKGEVSKELDTLCRSIKRNGKRYSKFNPHTKKDYNLFKAVINGDHIINGFRNRDICNKIYNEKKVSSDETKRRCTRISRSIAKLRGHGLISKVRNSYLYRVTKKGYRIFSAIILFHEKQFTYSYLNVA
jgi:hypothetical protein